METLDRREILLLKRTAGPSPKLKVGHCLSLVCLYGSFSLLEEGITGQVGDELDRLEIKAPLSRDVLPWIE